jgi:putative endonuclease
MCTAYILYSKKADRYYIGHTCDNVLERLRKHNSNHRGYTGKFNDWEIVFVEEFENKNLAYARERELKNYKDRERIKKLIAGKEHPGL